MLGVELTEEEFERFRGLIYRVAGIRIPATTAPSRASSAFTSVMSMC